MTGLPSSDFGLLTFGFLTIKRYGSTGSQPPKSNKVRGNDAKHYTIKLKCPAQIQLEMPNRNVQGEWCQLGKETCAILVVKTFGVET